MLAIASAANFRTSSLGSDSARINAGNASFAAGPTLFRAIQALFRRPSSGSLSVAKGCSLPQMPRLWRWQCAFCQSVISERESSIRSRDVISQLGHTFRKWSRSDPNIDEPAIVANLKSFAIDGFDEMEILGTSNLTQHDVTDTERVRIQRDNSAQLS
jgi:hypothetical protein